MGQEELGRALEGYKESIHVSYRRCFVGSKARIQMKNFHGMRYENEAVESH